MIQFRLLGTADLRSDCRETAPVLAQPKRLALLAYLAAAQPPIQRRDTLLGLFWPELDQEHARKALNKAIHFLRDALGPEALLSHGGTDISLNPDAIWSDVRAFRLALAVGDLAGALELYRGDLLPGFFVAAGPAFEEWLESERARLRQEALAAARTMAEREEASGRIPRAVEYARRAFELSSGDERPLRRLVELLERLGDRVAAVRLYEEYARTLARDLELQPAPETVALITRVRGAPAEVSAGRELSIGEGWVAAVAPAPASGGGRRRIGPITLAATVVATIVTVGLWLSPPAPAARPADPSADVVAVLPFTVRGTSELAYLEEGMVDLLSVNLAGEGGLRTVNPRTLLSLAARRGGAPALQDPERVRSFAKALGAGSYIAGSVLGMGDRVQLTAVLSPLNSDQDDTVHARVEGSIRDLARLVDRLTRELLVGRFHGEGGRFASLAASTTSSIEALKAFLEGEQYWRARQTDSAVTSFRRAVTYDSSFALAYYRLAVAASWAPGAPSGDAIDQALLHLGRLPPRSRDLILAFDARRRGEPARAESLYQAVLQASPDDGEAWFQLGSLLIHHPVLWGRPIAEVRQAFERALALDPQHPRAPGALSWLDGHEGYHGQSAARMQRLLDVDQGEANLLLRTALAYWNEDEEEQLKMTAALRGIRDDSELTYMPDFVGQRAGHLEGALNLAQILVHPSRSLALRARGYRFIANLELARGRTGAAAAVLAQLEKLAPDAGIQVTTLMLLNPSLPTGRVSAETMRTRLGAWAPTSRSDSLRRDYLLGLLAARLGDAAAAIRLADRLEADVRRGAASAPAEERLIRRDLALTIRADLAWRSHRPSLALSLLERRHPEAWDPLWMDLVDKESVQLEYPFRNQAYERWMRAELLNQLGRSAEALNWYAGLGLYPGEELAYLTHSRLRMGEIYERLGETSLAAEHYRRVLRLWAECESDLRPRVGEIQGRVARLGRAPGS
jgi:serine/threonine-protein kinase